MKGPRTTLDMLTALALPVGIALVVQGSSPATGATLVEAAPPTAVSFATDVKPILDKRCVSCHGGMWEGEERTELSLNMTTYEGLMAGSEYGTIIEPGNPDESLMIEMIEDGDMPDEGDPVPAAELAVLRTWIAEGANNN